MYVLLKRVVDESIAIIYFGRFIDFLQERFFYISENQIFYFLVLKVEKMSRIIPYITISFSGTAISS